MSKRNVVVNNLVAIADTHVGCQMALCRPTGAMLDGGGVYQPTRFQTSIWELWQAFWSEWIPTVARGEPFAVVHVGDAMDFVHHGSTTQWSHNINDQIREAEQILGPIVDLCEGRYYQIRGTEAHSGPSSHAEETLARAIGAIPLNDMHARYELWKYVGASPKTANRALVHFAHHIGTTGRTHYETSALMGELAESLTEAGRWRDRPPDVVVRAHRHRAMRVNLPAARGEAISLVVPGWQGKTPFAHRIPGGRQTQPQFGGALIRHGDEEHVYARLKVWRLDRQEAE